MNDSTLAAQYEEAAANYLAIAKKLRNADRNGKNLTARMDDAQVGHLRSPSIEPGSNPQRPDGVDENLRGRTNYSDPTGQAGIQLVETGDRARDDLARLRKGGPAAAKESRRLLDDAARYEPRKANAIEAQQEAEPGCTSCARVDSPGTVGMAKTQRSPWWNAIAREVTLADGSKAALCEWCRVQARTTGTLPEKAEVEAHRDGVRVKRKSA